MTNSKCDSVDSSDRRHTKIGWQQKNGGFSFGKITQNIYIFLQNYKI